MDFRLGKGKGKRGFV